MSNYRFYFPLLCQLHLYKGSSTLTLFHAIFAYAKNISTKPVELHLSPFENCVNTAEVVSLTCIITETIPLGEVGLLGVFSVCAQS